MKDEQTNLSGRSYHWIKPNDRIKNDLVIISLMGFITGVILGVSLMLWLTLPN